MSEADNDYELDVLRMVINKFLDESTSLTKSSLNALETRRDWVVWDVATRIYSQSGCRVELTMVRDIVNSRIRIIKNHLAEEARRLIEQRSQQEAEEVRRLIEQKAQQEAEEVRRAAESNPQFIAKRKSEIFFGVLKVISKQLYIDEKDVTLESHLLIDFATNPLDLFGFLMDLEEEFDIEISDEDFMNALGIVHPDMGCSLDISDILNIFNIKPKITSPTVSESKVGEKAIVRNVVELLWEKLHASGKMP